MIVISSTSGRTLALQENTCGGLSVTVCDGRQDGRSILLSRFPRPSGQNRAVPVSVVHAAPVSRSPVVAPCGRAADVLPYEVLEAAHLEVQEHERRAMVAVIEPIDMALAIAVVGGDEVGGVEAGASELQLGALPR